MVAFFSKEKGKNRTAGQLERGDSSIEEPLPGGGSGAAQGELVGLN